LAVAVAFGRFVGVGVGSPGSLGVGWAELERLLVGGEEIPVGDGWMVGADGPAPGGLADPSTPQAVTSTSTLGPSQAQGRMFLLTQRHAPAVTG
jgi:hypothetical protein